MAKMFNFDSASPTDSWEEKVRKIKANMRMAAKLVKPVADCNNLQPSFVMPPLPDLCHSHIPSKDTIVNEKDDAELDKMYLAICKLHIKNLTPEEIIERMKSIISLDNIRHKFLMNKIKLRLYKELLAYSKLYLDSKTSEEASEVKSIIDDIKIKISCLEEIKEVEELITGAKTDNNLFFLTSNNGTIFFYNSLLKDIPIAFYSQVLELIQLMKAGIFKQAKGLAPKPFFEIRYDMIRILLDRLSDGNYIIIDVFVKRNFTKKYEEMLVNRANQYIQSKDYYLMNFQNVAFIEEHKGYYDDIIALLESRAVGGERIRCQKK